MSYDIYLRATLAVCPTCGHATAEPDLPSPTYNLGKIFAHAFTSTGNDEIAGLRGLNGRKAMDTIASLYEAHARLLNSSLEATFRALETSNGWGTLNDARHVIGQLLDAAKAYPNHTWEIS